MPLSRSSCLSEIVTTNLYATKDSTDEALMLERSTWILFTVANLHYQLSYIIILPHRRNITASLETSALYFWIKTDQWSLFHSTFCCVY